MRLVRPDLRLMSAMLSYLKGEKPDEFAELRPRPVRN
jgi:hypothetical protein